jgi:hypothetical protein
MPVFIGVNHLWTNKIIKKWLILAKQNTLKLNKPFKIGDNCI